MSGAGKGFFPTGRMKREPGRARGVLRAVFFGVLFLFLSVPVLGDGKKERKVVRIAYQEFNRQMIVDENNIPVSGYAYDYIQTIGNYAGWNVQYVPCSSFFDSVRLLRANRVDLIYEISYTEERAEELLFPSEPMGYEYYYLYTSAENTAITPGDYESMNGKRVGITSGTILSELLKQWCETKNVNLQFVEYEEIAKKEADLYAGKIDLDLELSMLAKRNLSAVEKVGSSAYYLVARKDRQDLIDDINQATEKVHNNDLYYFTRMQEKYFSDTVLSRNLTTEEKNWLAGHDVLRVGYLDKYLPFSAKDEHGQATGAGIDAIREILKELKLDEKLKLEFICFDNQREGYKAVETGHIDLMFPAYVSNSVKHDFAIIESKTLATIAIDLAYVNEFGKGGRIGVNKNNLMQYYYTRDSYPDSEVVFYNDIQGCLDGLLSGTSDGTFLNGLRSEVLLKSGKYRTVHSGRARNDFTLRMAFSENEIGLMLLMNRGLTMLDHDFVNHASYAYLSRMYTFSTMEYLQDHIFQVILIVAVLVALVVAVIGYRVSNRRLSGMNRKLKEHGETIEKQRRKETELREQLEKKQGELQDALEMAQAASRAKTTFLSNMSHDIRTPMNAIVGFTGLAAGHIQEPERVREYLETIQQSSEHLLALINDVLDMSRIESGKMSLNEKEESLSEIFHVLGEIVYADVRSKKLDFRMEAVNVRDERVYCDRLRLNQVLLNLVSNAIKYTPCGGAVRLRIEQKPDTGEGLGSYEIRVKDNGIGMSEEFAKTIFEPFTREENTTVSGIQGTGLGMAITKSIVKMMGGSISLTSKRGKGSEFVVCLDLKTGDRKTEEPAIRPELEGGRSLIAAGDPGDCRNLADMLRDFGLCSEWCGTGREAFERAKELVRGGSRFKAALVDRRLPDMDGLEAVRLIRKAAGKELLVFLLAPYEQEDTGKEAEEAGVSGVVFQPFFPSDLRKLFEVSGEKTPGGQAAGETGAFSLKGKKVLMVDDSELNLKIGVLLLQGQGMLVDTAANGQIAVDKVRKNGVDAYDFIVMDVQMPVMDGYEATGILRKLPGGENLKIIAFSANAFEEDKEKSLQAGMDGHITKPLKIKDFMEELKRFV